MCGRFIFDGDTPHLRRAFGLAADAQDDGWGPASANMAPSQQVPAVVAAADGGARALRLRFGWPKPGGRKGLLINARLETVAHLPTFRALWQTHRCVIPAGGFYEWADGPPPRQAYSFRPADAACLALAGVWRPAPLPDAPEGALAILTEAAAPPVLQVHGRMPVLLDPSATAAFLHGAAPEPAALPRALPSSLICAQARPG